MRIAVMVIGFLLGIVLIGQITLAVGLAQINDNELLLSVLVVLLWLVGIAFAYGNPKVSRISFGLAFVVAWITAMSTDYSDMYVWMIVSAALGFMAQKGMKEKEEQDSITRQNAELLRHLRQQQGLTQSWQSTNSIKS